MNNNNTSNEFSDLVNKLYGYLGDNECKASFSMEQKALVQELHISGEMRKEYGRNVYKHLFEDADLPVGFPYQLNGIVELLKAIVENNMDDVDELKEMYEEVQGEVEEVINAPGNNNGNNGGNGNRPINGGRRKTRGKKHRRSTRKMGGARKSRKNRRTSSRRKAHRLH